MAGKLFTYAERCKIEVLYRQGLKPGKIAAALGRSRQGICNELARGRYTHTGYLKDYISYSADKAQTVADAAQSKKGRPIKLGHDYAFAERVRELICDNHYSPGAALALIRQGDFATSCCEVTLYSWIYKGFLNVKPSDLPEHGRRRKRRSYVERRISHKGLPSIEDRPQEIKNRETIGHWEMDLIISTSGDKTVLHVLQERKSRLQIIHKCEDRRAVTIRKVLDKIERKKITIKSITTDNGSEFLNYKSLIESIKGGQRYEVYYCHPYCSWEKGTVENGNRMIRRFFGKKRKLCTLTKKEVRAVNVWLANYPRESLDWKSPVQVYEELGGTVPSWLRHA